MLKLKNLLSIALVMFLAVSVNALAQTKGGVQRLDLDQITLDGTIVTATGAELNILDGVTSTAAELNILDGVTATAAEINLSSDISANFEDVTAANTLTSAECGKTMTLNSATEFATTLPAPTAGCKFKFIIKAAPSGASYTIVSNGGANIIAVSVNELETDTTEDGVWDDNADTVTFVDGLSVEGDMLDCVSDGTKFYCTGQVNADGAVTTSTT